MEKLLLGIILCVVFLFPQPANCEGNLRSGLFVTVIQDPPVLSSRNEIAKLIDFAKKGHINILFVQIYRANEAWFPSKVADDGPYETCLENVREDPFRLLIKEAHAAGIEVHAWLNMLSLSKNKDAVFLKRYGPSILTRNLKKKKDLKDYEIDNQYFLEPGDPRVRRALLEMLEEILRAYPELDGIQFDYIRYPDKNPKYGYTKINVERFKKETGLDTVKENSPAWNDWKRAQVTGFLEELVKMTREIRPGIQISTTGCAPYVRAYHEAFQDWPSWLERGLVDFVTVMTYSAELPEFEKFVLDARKRAVDLGKVNIAIGAYEMVDSPEIFGRELELCKRSGMNNCAIFHYGSLLQNPDLGTFLTGDKKGINK